MQTTHAVLPDVEVNLPAGQRPHVSCPGAAPYDPGRHADGCDEPTEQLVPAGQVIQSSTDVITASDAFWCLPPGHGSGEAEPSAQKYL